MPLSEVPSEEPVDRLGRLVQTGPAVAAAVPVAVWLTSW